MKEYKYPESANISTDKENTLVVGQRYDYKESSFIGECEFLGDESDDKFYKWRFKWTIHPFTDNDNSEFVCSETKEGKYYYSGMWHIYPLYSYVFKNRPYDAEKYANNH